MALPRTVLFCGKQIHNYLLLCLFLTNLNFAQFMDLIIYQNSLHLAKPQFFTNQLIAIFELQFCVFDSNNTVSWTFSLWLQKKVALLFDFTYYILSARSTSAFFSIPILHMTSCSFHQFVVRDSFVDPVVDECGLAGRM